MPAKILDGKALAARIKEELAREIALMRRKPALGLLMVGEDPASEVYVRSRAKACAQLGIETVERLLPADASENAVLLKLSALNENPTVDGIIVQQPLPAHLDARKILDAIRPEKDVDGASQASAGRLFATGSGFAPCTPRAVMRLIEETGVALEGARSVVVGRSTVVGKPLAMLLLAKNATVTVAHSKTKDLAAVTRQADVLVACAGRPGLVTGDMVKPGAVVIDVGINVGEDGSIAGDVDFASAREVAGWLTPVPGGVGPVTVAMLMQNTLAAARRPKAASKNLQ